jgi:hypothetical protein
MLGPVLQRILCCLVVVTVPTSLLAADPSPAMLYPHGTAWLNGSSIERSSAVFVGDLVQTQNDSAANIHAAGSSVLILASSLVQFEGNAVELEHGGVAVATSKGMGARVGDVTVSPSASVWTEFDVKDVDGTVRITARKGDLTISDGTGSTTLAQGQETTREESEAQKKRRKRRVAGAAPGAEGGILSSPVAVGVGAGVAGGLIIWALVQGDEPVSPTVP